MVRALDEQDAADHQALAGPIVLVEILPLSFAAQKDHRCREVIGHCHREADEDDFPANVEQIAQGPGEQPIARDIDPCVTLAGSMRSPKRKKEVEADDPAQNRCGCFLPDLTRLATAPSADFRARIWGNAPARASSATATPVFMSHSPLAHEVAMASQTEAAQECPFPPCSCPCSSLPRSLPSTSSGTRGRPSSARWASRTAPTRRPTIRWPTGSARPTATMTGCSPVTRWSPTPPGSSRPSTATMTARSIPTSSPTTDMTSPLSLG